MSTNYSAGDTAHYSHGEPTSYAARDTATASHGEPEHIHYSRAEPDLQTWPAHTRTVTGHKTVYTGIRLAIVYTVAYA